MKVCVRSHLHQRRQDLGHVPLVRRNVLLRMMQGWRCKPERVKQTASPRPAPHQVTD